MISALELKSRVLSQLRVKGYDGKDDNAVYFLAKELYRLHLVTVPPRQKRRDGKNDLPQKELDRANINIIAKNLRNYFRPQVVNGSIVEESSVTLRYLFAISEYLHCSMDYLTGRSDTPSEQIQDASITIGLRPDACKRISEYSDPQRLILDELIFDGHNKKDSRDHLGKLLDSIYRYAVLACDPDTAITVQNPGFNVCDHYQDAAETREILKFSAMQDFEKCLEHAADLTGIKTLISIAHSINPDTEKAPD